MIVLDRAVSVALFVVGAYLTKRVFTSEDLESGHAVFGSMVIAAVFAYAAMRLAGWL